jgi:protein SCO1/2
MKNVLIIAMMLFVFACREEHQSKLPYFNTPDFTPLFVPKNTVVKTITHTIPAFNFIDQNGKVITNKTVAGKIYVADFFFTRCNSICPRMTDNMQLVAKKFAGDTSILLLSHSVTPDSDSVFALKQYAEKHTIVNPNWHLLTGNKSAIYTIARQGYFADERLGYSKDTTEFLHSENVILVDRTGRIRGIYNGTLPFEMENLCKHIAMLKKEESSH